MKNINKHFSINTMMDLEEALNNLLDSLLPELSRIHIKTNIDISASIFCCISTDNIDTIDKFTIRSKMAFIQDELSEMELFDSVKEMPDFNRVLMNLYFSDNKIYAYGKHIKTIVYDEDGLRINNVN